MRNINKKNTKGQTITKKTKYNWLSKKVSLAL